LPEARARGRDALVADLDPLQFGTFWPELVHAGFEVIDAMDVEVELDEPYTAKISDKRPACHGQDGRELPPRKSSAAFGRLLQRLKPMKQEQAAWIWPEPVGAGSAPEMREPVPLPSFMAA
jgi:hypothetical protein